MARRTLTDEAWPRSNRWPPLRAADPELRGTMSGSRRAAPRASSRSPATRRQADMDDDRPGRRHVHRRCASQGAGRARAGARWLAAGRGAGETFGDVAANWIKRHVEPKGLRSRNEIARLLDRHILPKWRDREFVASSAAMLPPCSITSRTTMAPGRPTRADDRAHHRKLVRRAPRRLSAAGRARHAAAESTRPGTCAHSRRREIRAIWKQAEANGVFGAIIRLCLLTAQRRAKVGSMRCRIFRSTANGHSGRAAREGQRWHSDAAKDGDRYHPRAAGHGRKSVRVCRSRRWSVQRLVEAKERFDAKLRRHRAVGAA